jgi:hypothetical protein
MLSFAAIAIAWDRFTTGRLLMSVLLLMAHVAASIFYYTYSTTGIADSSAYYFDLFNLGSAPWRTGTVFVTKLCHVLKVGMGASYLDCFLLFQSFGFAGLMILARLFSEIEAKVGVPERRGYWILLFLPSVNFWTAAIGKDAPIFFALCLCLWTMMNLRKRFLYFCVSIAIMILFRAHVALISVTALAVSAFFGSSASLGRKAGLLTVALVGIWITSGAVQSALGVDATSISSVSDYLDQQNQSFANVAGNTSIGDASLPVRAFSLLFRPFFFDARGIQGVIASMENVAVAIGVLYLITHWRDLMHLVRRVPFVRFAAISAFLILFVLTLVYYNVGLGLRQRVMAYPMVFALLVALWSLREKHKLGAKPQPANRLMVNANANRAAIEL